jgi:hypothetical protein
MTMEKKIEQLWNERAITTALLQFGRTLDTGDWDTHRKCFTDRVTIDFERMTGQPPASLPADEWVPFVGLFQDRIRRHHVYTNFAITIDGDRAHALVYMTARHWRQTDHGDPTCNQYGWYDFWLEKHGDAWLIRKFRHDFRWVDGNEGIMTPHEPELLQAMGKVFCEANFAAARAET